MNIRRLFTDEAVQPYVPHKHRKCMVDKLERQFHVELVYFSQQFSSYEIDILGGLPNPAVSPALAEIFYVFLENTIGSERRGHRPTVSLMGDVLKTVAKDKLLLTPQLGMTDFRHELTDCSKMFLGFATRRLLRDERYAHLLNEQVSSGIASLMFQEMGNFLYAVTDKDYSDPDFEDDMIYLYRQLSRYRPKFDLSADDPVAQAFQSMTYAKRSYQNDFRQFAANDKI